jgi:hypothetical protein
MDSFCHVFKLYDLATKLISGKEESRIKEGAMTEIGPIIREVEVEPLVNPVPPKEVPKTNPEPIPEKPVRRREREPIGV